MFKYTIFFFKLKIKNTLPSGISTLYKFKPNLNGIRLGSTDQEMTTNKSSGRSTTKISQLTSQITSLCNILEGYQYLENTQVH